jgi:very-short-patch-repair endonuclease
MVTEKTVDQRKAQTVNRERARTMRISPVPMEQLFWSEVRNRKLGGYKFKRQHLIGRCIVDFVCTDRKVVVELDGPFHADRAEYDARRDGFLQSQGYRVLRFSNTQAADDIGIVPLTVKHALDTGAPSP